MTPPADRPRRRTMLGLLAGAAAGLAGCASGAPPVARGDSAPLRYTYGTDPSQFAELTLPAGGGPAPVVVILHGGFWLADFGISLARPLAADLAARGFAACAVEYRRVGAGGGWPQTGQDVVAAVAALRDESSRLDLSRVVALGHSAGGQLAVWLAAQRDAAVPLTGVVSQDGVLDLVGGARAGLGGGAVQDFLGGNPDDIPQTYAQASPLARLPLGVRSVCVHGTADSIVPFAQSQQFVEAARRSGDSSELVPFDGDHFAPIAVGSAAWQLCVDAVTRLT